ncbi:MAG: hypothetical protein M1817_001727 [Caeruleum heppii]|nr:MAG: hypothetical protein M1817_001727 [Caeruleum heppii]
MSTESKKRLALAIHDFLSSSLKDGTLTSEDKESIEVAQSCIAESFHVDPSDTAAMQDALGGQNLLGIYGVYEKLKSKRTASTSGSSSASEARPATPSAPKTPAQEQEAESLKGQGNAAMAKKDYPAAVDSYSKALSIIPGNPIYLSNRAAAYSASHQHDKAKADAQAAVDADPSYTKAWSRLGLALFALGDAKGSMEAYRQGIEHEGNGGSDAMKKGFETAKLRVEEAGSGGHSEGSPETTRSGSAGADGGAGSGGMPDLASLAGMLGGGRGGGSAGGGGGGPDLAGLMNNPMFANMAQNLMSNPQMMDSIMNNPRLREMANSFGGGGRGEGGGGSGGGGGGMPDLGSLMSDPSIAEM